MRRKPKGEPLAVNKAPVLDTSEPYPDFRYPTPNQCRAVRDDLLAFHGFPEDFARYQKKRTAGTDAEPLGCDREDEDEGEDEKEAVLDGLISTLLSQNTTESNSKKAFLSLKSAFPSWEDVLDAEQKSIEEAIRCGGLAKTKASRIRGILKDLKSKRGELCLEYLRGMSVERAKAELSRFKGIGPKTVACVLMFNLQQDDFPVDTHVLRISKAIGWVPIKADREKAYLHLNRRIPDELKFDLNCFLFTHGKTCQLCSAKGSNQLQGSVQSTCPLRRYCCITKQKC